MLVSLNKFKEDIAAERIQGIYKVKPINRVYKIGDPRAHKRPFQEQFQNSNDDNFQTILRVQLESSTYEKEEPVIIQPYYNVYNNKAQELYYMFSRTDLKG